MQAGGVVSMVLLWGVGSSDHGSVLNRNRFFCWQRGHCRGGGEGDVASVEGGVECVWNRQLHGFGQWRERVVHEGI